MHRLDQTYNAVFNWCWYLKKNFFLFFIYIYMSAYDFAYKYKLSNLCHIIYR